MSLEEFAKRGVAAQKAVDEIVGPRPVQFELTAEEYGELVMTLGWAHGMMKQMGFSDESLDRHLRVVNRLVAQAGS